MDDDGLRVPNEDDADAIWRFALEFNGYEEFGSFEGSAEAARVKARSSLRDLRNELFFAARASRHGGDDRYIEVFRELAPLLRRYANR